jgi:hypothetical protein
MASKLVNHPAFPVTPYAGDVNNSPLRGNSGMSIRDYFAAVALASLINDKIEPDATAEEAYVFADAMLVERETKYEK